MTATAVKSKAKAGPVPAQAAEPPPPAAPSRRRGMTPLTPMRREAAKRMRVLAAQVQDSHPDMTVHEHLRDAARTLEAGNEEGAQRHLRAAMFALTPQSLMRNGLHTDDSHVAARDAMHSVHRHLLLVKDITDVAAKNQEALRRDSYGDDATSNPPPVSPVRADPNAGYGPGALAQKPTVRQPPGNQALNAPAKTGSGGSDPAVADPVGPQPRGSKQFSYGWGDLAQLIELVGDGHGHHVAGTPDVYSHGWKPLSGSVVGEDGIRRPGKGAVLKKAAAVPVKVPAVATGKAPAPGNPKSVLSGSHPADRLTVAADPGTTAKAMSDADLKKADQEFSRRAAVLGKLGQKSRAHQAVLAEVQNRRGAAGKPKVPARLPAASSRKSAAREGAGPQADLNAAIKSGVASRKAPGSAKVLGSQGEQGGTEIVTFGNGAQYVHKDFKGTVLPYPESMGGPRPMPLKEKKLQVAKESLAAKISDVIGAGAPAILRDPHSATGFYEPKVAGKSAMEHFSGGKRDPAKMYDSPEGMKIGLMDAVIGADDRHLGNVMITPGGKPVPIDHNDTWVTGQRLLTRSPFEVALGKRIKAGKSPFSVADLDQVKQKIEALKPEFDAMPDGNGAKYYQMTMDKLAQIRGQVAGK